ncbi:MAG: hypothetical protein Q9209_003508 [Squamulea sp. 1 TL-2023]
MPQHSLARPRHQHVGKTRPEVNHQAAVKDGPTPQAMTKQRVQDYRNELDRIKDGRVNKRSPSYQKKLEKRPPIREAEEEEEEGMVIMDDVATTNVMAPAIEIPPTNGTTAAVTNTTANDIATASPMAPANALAPANAMALANTTAPLNAITPTNATTPAYATAPLNTTTPAHKTPTMTDTPITSMTTPAADSIATTNAIPPSNTEVDQEVEAEPDNVKREDVRGTGILSFTNGEVDNGEWLE